VASFSRIFHSRNHASPKICSIAVLPLESLSSDPSQDYFADGMTDELISALEQISALRVISRTSIMTYKRVRKLLPEIARELNVEAVVEGTVLRFDDRVRITAQLIRVPIERHIWAQSFEGDLRDTLVLQSSVARAIAEQIRATVTEQEQATLQNSKPVNPMAYEAYLKGRYFMNKRTGDGLKKAIEYFSHAIERDPTYARGRAALSKPLTRLAEVVLACVRGTQPTLSARRSWISDTAPGHHPPARPGHSGLSASTQTDLKPTELRRSEASAPSIRECLPCLPAHSRCASASKRDPVPRMIKRVVFLR
jgi:TolB-like protein